MCARNPSYIPGYQSNQVCPSPCNQRNNCKQCLTNSASVGSHSTCLWNPLENLCMDSQFSSLLDVTHLGQLITDPQSCLIGCSNYTSCLACQAQPHCGWLYDERSAGSGLGVCSEVSRQQSAASNSTWSFFKCPPENECLNGHHTCDQQVEVCVDEEIGKLLCTVSVP